MATSLNGAKKVAKISQERNSAQNNSIDLNQLCQTHLTKEFPSLEKLYRHLHANPELSFQEKNTSRRVAEELSKTNFAVTEKVGGHGVVGVFENGTGPTLLLRTDMDALPIEEKTGVPYASKVRATNDQGEQVGVMHACGHDAHMTIFVGVARLLTQLRKHWRGTIVAIGQPAEERLGGAKAMIADGLFTRFPKPDYCLGLHVSATLPAGTIGYTEGFMLGSVDSINITVRGIGGHAAFPQTAKDPIVLASQLVLALQTISSREVSPTDPVVVSVGSIHGGTQHNVIPDEVRLQLTVRSYSDETREKMIVAIKRIAEGLGRAAGLPKKLFPTVTITNESTVATYNDPVLTRRLANVFINRFGKEKVVWQKPVMGGEDFAMYGRTREKIPISFFWVGAVAPENFKRGRAGNLPPLHSCYFYPDTEPTIKTGVTAMIAAALGLLQESQKL